MSLLLSSPRDKSEGIQALKYCLALFVMTHAKGATQAQIVQHIAQMDAWPGGLDVTARLETFPAKKRTTLTLTFDQVEATNVGPRH